MAASIYGSQTLPTPQSLAAYLQALQTKTNNPTNNSAGLDGSTANGDVGTVASGTGKSSNGKNATDPTGLQPLDVVTLSAEAQRLLANAQAPSAGPGSLATYLNTSNAADATSNSPIGISDIGAIAQFRQWLSQPLGQPVPYPGDQSATNATAPGTSPGSSDDSTSGDQASATAPVSATSS